jgi:ATP-dependent DNA helicase PIF1
MNEDTAANPPAPAAPVFINTPEQDAVIRDVTALENILCSGSAGTGKSHLLKQMRGYFADMYCRLGVVGSTGIAAVNVGGLTLHTWAGLGMGDAPAETIANRILFGDNRRAFENITQTNHLAIDEISMLSASLLDKVDVIFRKVRKMDLPFGGMQLIMFGDFLQLPPVSTNNSKPEGFAFEAKVWKEAKVKTHVLTKVFRQADQSFADVLNDIRVGNYTPAVSDLLMSRYQQPDPTPEFPPVILTTHNADADAINGRRLAMIEAAQHGYDADDQGSDRAKKILERCLMPARVELKVGAQVMCCVNLDQDLGIVNGTLGKVVDFTGFSKLPVVLFANGIRMTIEAQRWIIRENEKEIGSRTQLPLRLAWAITVHKSQGMTLDKVEVHLAKAFEFGQAYVALSRARTLGGLFIASGSKKSIKAHPKAIAFYENAKP